MEDEKKGGGRLEFTTRNAKVAMYPGRWFWQRGSTSSCCVGLRVMQAERHCLRGMDPSALLCETTRDASRGSTCHSNE